MALVEGRGAPEILRIMISRRDAAITGGPRDRSLHGESLPCEHCNFHQDRLRDGDLCAAACRQRSWCDYLWGKVGARLVFAVVREAAATDTKGNRRDEVTFCGEGAARSL